eukprot:CAMPEP_0197001236 /NCGR_PEP_ID=MMETSP1380-20130617/5978_1 /TAXON_ID=5936 /ORGANISM="Euplotes crassus, Strain CT5" /LENGTH=173 /DNA_ID=CAMNT_0042418819 /DNA_START=945 /DNA_END=1467 /DNA_ORIENTATION=+
MTCPTCRKDLNNLYKPAIEKFNGGPDLDANQIRDLYAEDILEMQNKMVVVINDLEEVDDENFDSFEFVSNPEIQLEENKENQDGKSANEESKLAAQISDADYGRNRPSMLVSRNLMNSNNLRNIDNPGEARMNQSVYQKNPQTEELEEIYTYISTNQAQTLHQLSKLLNKASQ